MNLYSKNIPLSHIVYYSSFVIPLVLLFLYFGTGSEALNKILFNSDILYFPTLYKDLFVDHYRIKGWYIPGSPNIFPDMLFYFILMFITGKTAWATFLFAFLQLFILLLLWNVLIRKILPGMSLYIIAMGNFLLAVFFLVSLIDREIYITFHLVSNTYHLGAFINSLIALNLVFGYIKTRKNHFLLLLFLLGLIAMVSDRLFLLLFCLPFLVSMVSVVRKSKNHRVLLTLSICIALISMGGFIGLHYLKNILNVNIADVHVNVTVENMTKSWKILSTYLFRYFLHLRYFTVILIITIVSFFIATGYFLINLKKLLAGIELSDPQSYFHIFNLFFIVFELVAFFAPVVTGGYENSASLRYNIFVFYFGLLYFGVIIARLCLNCIWIQRSVKILSLLLLIVYGGIIGERFLNNKPVEGFRNYINYYPAVARFLDQLNSKYDLKQGVGTYWLGKVGLHFSKQDIRLYTIYNEGLAPYPKVGNANWYFKTGYGKYDPPVFNFILLENPVKEEAIKAVEGKVGQVLATEEYGNIVFFLVNDFIYPGGRSVPELLNQPE